MARPELRDVAPVEAVEAFRAKGYHVGFDWRDTEAAAHAASFTVAKAMRLDLLVDLREAVDEAIAEGETFEHFRARLEPTLRARGWWGRQRMRDPETGEERIVQLGSPHRLRTIFETNLRTSYARGRWQRIERLREQMPYLRYVAVLDRRTRPEHRAWHGTVLPVEHPFWETHAPPNGWRCRCIVQQLSEHGLAQAGLSVSDGPPPDSGRTRVWVNRRTGERVQVPVGIDPGWAHNPGAVEPVATATRLHAGKVAAAPTTLASTAARPDLDSLITTGRELREELLAESDGPDALRAAVVERLRRDRGAGTVTAMVTRAGAGDGGAVERVEAASRQFPARWVEVANGTPAVVRRQEAGRGLRGGYWRAQSGEPAVLAVSEPDNALHEYVHHLQATMPALDELFQKLHRRRTRGEPVVPLGEYRVTGRRDQYIDAYFGAEYGAGEGQAPEVMTRAYQVFFHGVEKATLKRLMEDDPEMLDLVLATLLEWNP